MSIQSEISRITNEVDSQSNIISQIKIKLDGKAGGANVETCNLTVSVENQNNPLIWGIFATVLTESGVSANVPFVADYEGMGTTPQTAMATCNNIVSGSIATVSVLFLSTTTRQPYEMITSDGLEIVNYDMFTLYVKINGNNTSESIVIRNV